MTSLVGASAVAAEQAATVVARCDELARISSMPQGICRVYLSPQHAEANALAGLWMQQAGMRTWQDAAGNQRGRIDSANPDAPVLIIGSHLDTVVDAGRYDGIVGVLMAIATVERLRERLDALPFAIEVIAFCDEEGTRFGKALMGSAAVAGQWEDAWWTLTDEEGTTLRQAFEQFGLDPDRIGDAALCPQNLVGYLEAHIEQGPYLDRAGQPLAVVTSIAGASRFSVEVIGEARHAGGTPYESRHDALLGAAEAAVAIERICIAEQHVGTVGTISVEPGSVNVVPGRARFSVDLRGEFDAGRERVWEMIIAEFDRIAAHRGLAVVPTQLHDAPAVFCTQRMMDAVHAGILGAGLEDPPKLFSKAGHDAMSLGMITEVGMLFLRNPDGISHHPDEFVSEADIALGLDALAEAVLALARGAGR